MSTVKFVFGLCLTFLPVVFMSSTGDMFLAVIMSIGLGIVFDKEYQ